MLGAEGVDMDWLVTNIVPLLALAASLVVAGLQLQMKSRFDKEFHRFEYAHDKTADAIDQINAALMEEAMNIGVVLQNYGDAKIFKRRFNEMHDCINKLNAVAQTSLIYTPDEMIKPMNEVMSLLGDHHQFCMQLAYHTESFDEETQSAIKRELHKFNSTTTPTGIRLQKQFKAWIDGKRGSRTS
jgi:hypothetical protein